MIASFGPLDQLKFLGFENAFSSDGPFKSNFSRIFLHDKKTLCMTSHPAWTWTHGHKVTFIILDDQLEAKRKKHLTEIGDRGEG